MTTLEEQLKRFRASGARPALNKRRRFKTKKFEVLQSIQAIGSVLQIDPAHSETSSRERTRHTSITPRHSTELVDYKLERAAFDKSKPKLMSQYPGKYVVFVGEDMLGPFESFLIAVKEAYRKHGRRPVYTKQLVPDDSSR